MSSTVKVGKRRAAAAVGLLVAAQLLAACQSSHAEKDMAAGIELPLPTAVPVSSPDVLAARGNIVEQSDVAHTYADLSGVIGQARRAVYRSVSGVDGRAREVSGVFFLPDRNPPAGGWPVISLAHGTTGIDNNCGPSLDPDLMGFLPAVEGLLGGGYAVAVTDYEGLGAPGSHPYLEPRTEAYNVIDAVRALRNIYPDVSTRWMALGNSQGGQAAWAANELSETYGSGLDLVGTVALSPAANVTALADLAKSGSLTDEQRNVMPLVVGGLRRYDSTVDEQALMGPELLLHQKQMFGCSAGAAGVRSEYATSAALRPASPASQQQFRDALRRIALPQGRLSAPMLVINGLEDQTIPHDWVSAAVAASCRLGGQIEHAEIPGAGHTDLGESANQTQASWIEARFASQPAPTNCGSNG